MNPPLSHVADAQSAKTSTFSQRSTLAWWSMIIGIFAAIAISFSSPPNAAVAQLYSSSNLTSDRSIHSTNTTTSLRSDLPKAALTQYTLPITNLSAWTPYGGSFSTTRKGHLEAAFSMGGKAMLTNFSPRYQQHDVGNFILEANLHIKSGSGDAGLIFRASEPGAGADAYRGYYAGISAGRGQVVLGKADGKDFERLAVAPVEVVRGKRYRIEIEAVGSRIVVRVGSDVEPQIVADDLTYARGMVGVRVYKTEALFDHVSLSVP